ncbi:sirohydrochlorin cobaltochelatase [Anaerostipes sp.]|uniref:sirohydrochlorin cobaltochelatase n=1 Tax=Anaerostipes sp. TaxID=1872530 RepID=UPI003FF03F13
MKIGTIVVSFGTSHADARQNSLRAIYQDIVQEKKEDFIDEAYTSGMILDKLSKEGIEIDTVDQALQKAVEKEVTDLFVVVTHMIPGIEYQKILGIIDHYKDQFENIKVTTPVLDKEEDCQSLVPVLKEMFSFKDSYEYILMGHGSEDAANIRYAQMNEALKKAGLFYVRIASVEAKPDLSDAMQHLETMEQKKKVILYPFMVVAGDHAKNDMAGDEEESYATMLKKAGYEVEIHIKGLGEYPQFRKIYLEKYRKICDLSK